MLLRTDSARGDAQASQSVINGEAGKDRWANVFAAAFA